MGAPVLDSNGGKPFTREPWHRDPATKILVKGGRHRTVPETGRVPRFIGFILMAAAIAGAAGYLAGGARQSTEPPSSAASPGTVIDPSASLVAAHVQLPNRDAERPAGQATTVDIAPPRERRATADTTVAAPRPAPPAPSSASRVLPPDKQALEIAAKMKLGADLMAAGDIVAARTMFERVAEADEAAGALALAETYDPAVLGAMPLRGGIVPDSELARRWYEKARELGSTAASERIARFAGQ